jgi:hypothetical protein
LPSPFPTDHAIESPAIHNRRGASAVRPLRHFVPGVVVLVVALERGTVVGVLCVVGGVADGLSSSLSSAAAPTAIAAPATTPTATISAIHQPRRVRRVRWARRSARLARGERGDG